MSTITHNQNTPLILDKCFEVGEKTPFGLRWGGKTITLTQDHIKALLSGKYVAIDVENEYVEFLKLGQTIPSETK